MFALKSTASRRARPMTRIGFGHRLDRRLLNKGFRAGWPLLTLNLIKARRLAAAPAARLAARRLARPIIADSNWAGYIPQYEGYRAFSPDCFLHLLEVVTACQSVFLRREAILSDKNSFGKPYFFNLLAADDLREHPVLVNFALSEMVTEAVTGYIGHLPRLHSIGLFYSAVNDTVAGSQLFHVDGDGLAQIKCLINIWDVGAGGGAFTFLPKPHTSRLFRSGGLLKTLTDVDVFQTVPEERQVVAEGPPGSGVFVDTCRCLHQGSRAKERPRLVFQFQYVPRPDTLLEQAPGRPESGSHLLVTRQLLEGMRFTNPNAMLFVE
jgi:hypothetical protein